MSETLESWILKQKIYSTKLLDSLVELGANDSIDLLDLTEEDISNFEPFLKKLEFVRLKRGISVLRENVDRIEKANGKLKDTNEFNIVVTDATVIPINDGKISLKEQFIISEGKKYKRPPLPFSCVEDGCDGILSSKLGQRINNYLRSLNNGPNFRWIVSCSKCTNKWHSCHFLCGHLQKISRIGGSSDIIRHEQGRFNRWQKKVKPPCSKNPQSEAILSRYQAQKSGTRVNGIDEQNEPDTQHFSEKDVDNYKSFDSEFNSILQSMEKDHLNFNNDVDINDLGTVSTAIDSNYDGSALPLGTIRSNDITSNQIEPSNKRVKMTSSKQDNGINVCPRGVFDSDASDEQIDQLCNEVIEKCLLDDFEN